MANTIGIKDSNGIIQPRLLDPTGVASALGNETLAADVTALKDEINGITVGAGFIPDETQLAAINSTVTAGWKQGIDTGLATAVQTETDPTVPAWAKAENKPSYAVSEITGAASSDDLAAEATAREQADATLQAAIDAEKARSEAVDEAQGIALDNQVSKAEEEHAEIGGRIDGVITNLETNYVPLTGATMTGGLVLNADAADPLGAVTKQQLDAAIAANKTKSLTFHGLISMTEPTVDMHAGDFWYQPAAVGEAPDTNFPWNVRSYINGAWTEETEEYTPETLDLWRYVDIATGFYYIGGIWNILNYDADSFGTDFEIIDGVVNIAKGSIVNSDLAENAAIAQSKLDLNIDTHPIEDSPNLAQSGGVYAQLALKANITDRGDLSALTTSDKSTLVGAINALNVAKADKAIGAVVGNLLAADANGNHVDSGSKAADFALKTDLDTKLDNQNAVRSNIDVLEYILSLPAGFFAFTTNGGITNGYDYTTYHGQKRQLAGNSDFTTVTAITNKSVMYVNDWDGVNWRGWQEIAEMSALASLVKKSEVYRGDLNDLWQAAQLPFIGGYTVEVGNKPSSVDGYIIAMPYDTRAYCAQIAVDADNKMFTRLNTSGTDGTGWTAWVQQAAKADVDNRIRVVDGGIKTSWVHLCAVHTSFSGQLQIRSTGAATDQRVICDIDIAQSSLNVQTPIGAYFNAKMLVNSRIGYSTRGDGSRIADFWLQRSTGATTSIREPRVIITTATGTAYSDAESPMDDSAATITVLSASGLVDIATT